MDTNWRCIVVNLEKVQLLKMMKSQYRTLQRRDAELTNRLMEVALSFEALMKEGNELVREMGENDPLFFQAYVTDVVSLPEEWTRKVEVNDN
jgi:hypothetical protein